MPNVNTAELLKSLETLYVKEEFNGTIDLLLKSKHRFDEGLFHYNLGTVHAKVGNHAAGRYHFEKSIKSGFVNNKVINNLEVVNERLQVEDIGTSSEIYDQLLNTSLKIPDSCYLTMSLLLLIFGLLLFRKKIVKGVKKFGLLVLVSTLPWGFNHFYLKGINFAIAMKETKLYEGPSKIYTEKFLIKPGTKFIFSKINDGWLYIERPLFLSGWIVRDDAGIY